jgi:hypothetical protein
MKICNKCKVEKELTEFYKSKHGKYGVDSECKLCRSYYKKQYCIDHKEKLIQDNRRYNLEHKKEMRQYYVNNKEKIKQSRTEHREEIRRYQNNRRKVNKNYQLAHDLRVRVRHARKNNQKIGSAVRDLGCTIEFLKQYIESKFQPGMNWDNYGYYGWHIDHIIPLASFDLTNREQFLKACHYTNLQPLWAKDNISKGNKILNDFVNCGF